MARHPRGAKGATGCEAYPEHINDPETQPELLTVDDIAERLDAPPNFVVLTLDRDGIKPVESSDSWLEGHKTENLRYRRDEIERWISEQGSP